MIDFSKKQNLYILDNKKERTYNTISKFMRFLGEEYTILYLDFSYDKNKSIGEGHLTYRSMSYEMGSSSKDFREFVKSNLRNVDIVIVDINGSHNIPLILENIDLFSEVNFNILCLEKRSQSILDSPMRFDEIYFVNDKILAMGADFEIDYEGFKTQFIRNLKIDNLL